MVKIVRAGMTKEEAQNEQKRFWSKSSDSICVSTLDLVELGIDNLTRGCHSAAVAAGWYSDLDTGMHKVLNFGERLALIHSEVSECFEGGRKDLSSDHLPGFSMVEEELADTIIRICDLAGAMRLRLSEAILSKLEFNNERPDHKPEARLAEGGKQF